MIQIITWYLNPIGTPSMPDTAQKKDILVTTKKRSYLSEDANKQCISRYKYAKAS